MAKDFADISRLTEAAEMNASNKRDSVAKMMKAWESKNARRALQGAGLSTMAVTLAACGGSDDTATTTPVTPTAPAAQTFSLTIGADNVSGGDGNDVINAGTVATTDSTGAVVNNPTLSATDVISGGLGADTLNITEVAAISVPTVTVTGVETVNFTSGAGVTASIATWSGVNTVNVTATGATNITTAATTDVNITSTNTNTTTAVNGAEDITIVSAGVTDTAATITVGATTAAKGAVSITQTTKFVDGFNDVAPTITVTGGTTVNIAQNIAGASDASQATDTTSEIFTGGAVQVTGTADTTTVTVTQTAANTAVNFAAATAATATATGTLAVAGETGVVNGAVTIADKNAASVTDAGTITAVTLNNYGNSTVDSGALATVNISGTGGTLGLTAGALTTAAVSTLTINASKATAGAITADADYKTINVVGSTDTSTVANLTATGATTLNVSGDAKVTFTAQTLAAVTDINVTNTAGVSLGTAIGNAVSFDAVGGADAVSIGATTKTISMGAGNDTVTVNVAALGKAGAVDAGEGDDTLVMTGANAVTASATSTFGNTISGFEVLRVTGDNSNNASAVNLANLDGINKIVVAGDQDYTFSGVNPSASLTLQGTAASTTDTTLSMVNASGSADSVSVTLANNTAGAQDFGTLTVAAVETLAITTSDTGTVAAGRQYATVDVLDVTLADATTITVTGNNGLNMGTNTAAKVTTFDASGVKADNSVEDIAANLAVTYASGNTTAGANLTLTGGAGNDTLTGNKNDDTISGNAGNDTLAGSTGTDTINGGDGTDTYAMTSAQIATNIEGAGTGTSTGLAVNLGATAITGAAVLAATGQNLKSGATLASNTVAYVFNGELTTNSGVVDTLTSIENVTLATAGIHYVMGSAGANVIDFGADANLTAVDFINGGAGADVLKFTAAAGTATVDDLTAVETISVTAAGNAATTLALTYTAANTDAITIDATALTGGTAKLTVDLSADGEVDGYITVNGGAGADVITAGDGGALITGGAGNDVITGHAGIDTINIKFGGDGVDTIASFTAGAGGDVIAFTGTSDVKGANVDADGFLLISTSAAHVIVDGLTVFSGAAMTATDAGATLTAAEIATFLSDTNGSTTGAHAVTMGAATDVAYVLIEGADGTGSNPSSTLARVTGGGDQAIDTADITIIAHFTALESEDFLAANISNFA